MIQLRLSREVEEFRNVFRAWLEANPPPQTKQDSSLATFVDVGRAWQAKLASGNWVGVYWPKEFGGRSLTLVEEAVVQEELVRVKAPQLLGLFGLTMVGPVLISHGTQSQRQRFLSNILSAREIWCQGFSEPGAGSDLAAVRTKARLADNGFYVTGQKVWTSFAQIADWCFLLCRTSDEDTPHKGLTYLLVDMKGQGISHKPLRQISGDEEFNEVFFDEVFVPRENVVGSVGDGWKIAISTLMFERVILTFARQLQSEVALRGLVGRFGKDAEISQRVKMAKAIVRGCAVRALAYEHLLEYAAGKSPGPEGSLDKLFWTESFQEISKLGMSLLGSKAALGENSIETGPEVHRYLYSRGRTIAAGTSEIQKNIIAERVLGLPRLKYSL